MKTILVPTDFSQNATNALQYAAALASLVRGKLILVNIINIPATPIESGIVFPPDAQMEEDYKQELNKLSKELRLENGFRFEVETICQYGYFMSNLNELVKAKAVDLVVMGTKGASDFLDNIVGTNTSEYIKVATCPVLTIPAQANFKGIKNLAYASDFETEETIFLQQLFSIAEPFQAGVSIVNIKSNRQLNIVADEQIIKEINRNFPDNNFCIVQIKENDVVAGLQQFVQENEIDVLAFSVQERGFIDSIFHKSVSKKLVYHPTLPLLALPAKPYRSPKVNTDNQKQNSASMK